MQLEQDIAQKEADITIRNGEVNSLQNMLNSLSSTLKQLEAQKGEAQKRLDDLDSQVRPLMIHPFSPSVSVVIHWISHFVFVFFHCVDFDFVENDIRQRYSRNSK